MAKIITEFFKMSSVVGTINWRPLIWFEMLLVMSELLRMFPVTMSMVTIVIIALDTEIMTIGAKIVVVAVVHVERRLRINILKVVVIYGHRWTSSLSRTK